MPKIDKIQGKKWLEYDHVLVELVCGFIALPDIQGDVGHARGQFWHYE